MSAQQFDNNPVAQRTNQDIEQTMDKIKALRVEAAAGLSRSENLGEDASNRVERIANSLTV